MSIVESIHWSTWNPHLSIHDWTPADLFPTQRAITTVAVAVSPTTDTSRSPRLRPFSPSADPAPSDTIGPRFQVLALLWRFSPDMLCLCNE
jgi:hypothetical protein